jgi:hypothetical protein
MKLLNLGGRKSSKWADEFIEMAITALLTDKSEEMIFTCQPERVEMKARIDGAWHSTLPLTPESARDAGTVNFGDTVLDALKRMPRERSVKIDGVDHSVRLQVQIDARTVRVLPEYAAI